MSANQSLQELLFRLDQSWTTKTQQDVQATPEAMDEDVMKVALQLGMEAGEWEDGRLRQLAAQTTNSQTEGAGI